MVFSEAPVLGLAKALVSYSYNGDESFDLSYRFVLQNSGDVQVNNLSINDDLATVFAAANSYSVKQLSSSDLLVNGSFNGAADTQLLAPGQYLLAGQEAMIDLIVTVYPGNQLGPYSNSAQAEGESPANPTPGVANLSDDSTNGNDPDPDTAGVNAAANPAPGDDSEPTVVTFDLAAIVGNVYGDANLNAQPNSGEGFGGVTLDLMAAGPDGQWGTADDAVIASTTTAADGSYRFDDIYPAEVRVVVHAPVPGQYEAANRVITAQLATEARADFPYIDPAGVIYDAITKELIEGAVVNIYQDNNSNGIYDNGDTLAFTQTTKADGAYAWPMAGPVAYVMTVTPPSDIYTFPSTIIPATTAPDPLPDSLNDLDGLASGIYYLNYRFVLTSGDLINNDIPLDSPTEGSILLQKEAHKREVSKGDIVPYTITAQSLVGGSLPEVRIEDLTPPGFKVIDDSARLIRAGADGELDTRDDIVTAISLSQTRPATFAPLTFAANEKLKLRYLLTVGSGVGTGSYKNTATPYIRDFVVGNTASARVQVIDDPIFDKTTVIGKVFHDRDGDGWQDPAHATGLTLSYPAAAGKAAQLRFGQGERVGQWQSVSFDEQGVLALGDLVGRDTARQAPAFVELQLPDVTVPEAVELRSKEGGLWQRGERGWQARHRGELAKGLNGQSLSVTEPAAAQGDRWVLRVSNQGVNEEGIAGVRLATVEGLLIETDAFGRYHLADVATGRFERGRNFIIKVDPSTLPAGSSFTTENPRVKRLTPALMTQFNFGVKLPVEASSPLSVAAVNEQGSGTQTSQPATNTWRFYTADGGVVWGNEDPSLPEPRLSITGPAYATVENGRIVEPLRFKTYSNYHAFIQRWQLVLYRDSEGLESLATLSGESLRAHREISWQPEALSLTTRTDDVIYYRLRVFDEQGRFDETTIKSMHLLHPDTLTIGSNDEGEKPEPAENFGNSELSHRSIPIQGSRVRLQGSHLTQTDALEVNGEAVPVDSQGKFAYEQLLPVGEHPLSVVRHQGDTVEEHAQAFEVTGEHFFMVAIADITAAEVNIDGSVEPLNDEDHYDNGTVIDGRFGFYLKGKIKGKYLLTAQLDTEELALDELLSGLDDKDPRAVFRNLDPEKYYPVYGDDSTVVDDTDSQGKFYVRLDWDRSAALWGNYNTEINGNELARYERSLYGAKLDYNSTDVTAYGDASVSAKVMLSEPQTLFGHNEFFATGGSLYYLRHGELVEGSAKAWVEVRDRDSGRVIENVPLEVGRDYQIDELQGRILLSRPLLQSAGSAASIVRGTALEGHDVVLLVDYEYLPASIAASGDFGAAANGRWWVNDRIALGATYVEESRDDQDYTLSGVDATYRWAKGSYIKVEAAESQAIQAASGMYSTDGGLSFVDINRNPAADRDGEAFSVEARANLREYTEIDLSVAAWWKLRDNGFSTARQNEGVEREDYGTEFIWQASEKLAVAMRAAVVERKTVSEEQRLSVQADYALSEAWTVSAEVREEKDKAVTQTAEQATLAAVKAEVALNPSLDVYGIAQTAFDASADYEDNDRYTLGAKQRWRNANVFAEASDGDRGEAYQLGVDYKLTDNIDLYTSYLMSPDGSDLGDSAGNTFTLGGKSRLSDQLSVFTEYQFLNGKEQSGLSHIYGLDYTTRAGWAFGLALQQGELEDVIGEDVDRQGISVSAAFDGSDQRFASRLEYRDDSGDVDEYQWLLASSYDYRFNREWRALTKLNYSFSEDRITEQTLAKFVEASIGAAYRPVANNRWNLLAMYTFVYDIPGLEQTPERLPEKGNIWSLEALYDIDQNWGVGAKAAYKQSRVRVQRDSGPWYDSETYLYAARVRYHVIKNWDALAEYRWLDARGADDRRAGALLAFYRHLGENGKIGAGYNFADFDDDLTRLDYDSKGWFLNVIGKY